MGKQSSSKSNQSKGNVSSVSKGKIVERIAALMHSQPGVKVERNQRLTPINGRGRKREIDVLLTCSVAGYPIQMAIECKNEKRPIDSPTIEAFYGKLRHLGIPPQHGIFISASGYTSDAIDNATADGIRTLTLRGLSDENIKSSIVGAFQSIIYLLLEVISMSITNDMPPGNNDAFSFYNEEDKVEALIPDLVWSSWLSNDFSLVLGESEVELAVPPNLQQKVGERLVDVHSINAKVRVTGLVVTLEGKAKEYTLVNTLNDTIEKGLIDVSFASSETGVPITAFVDEAQLQDFLLRVETNVIRITTDRIKLPRILVGPAFWPPSERTAKILMEHGRAFQTGEMSEFRPLDITQVEGTNLASMWEPIWEGHPAG